MPQNITDVITYTTPVQSVADGDGATGANFLLGPQALANRTAYLNNLTSNPAAGVSAIRNVTNAAALTALSSPVSGSVAIIPGTGLYVYSSASSATVDNFLVVNGPAGVGRWLIEFQGIANTASGIAVVSAAGKLPGAIMPNAIVTIVSATQSSAQTIPANQTSLIDVTGVTVTVTAAIGDILLVDAAVPLINSSTSSATFANLAIVSNQASPGTASYTYASDGTAFTGISAQTTPTAPYSASTLVQRLVCTAAGSVTVKLQAQNNTALGAFAIGVASAVPAYATLRVQQIRP